MSSDRGILMKHIFSCGILWKWQPTRFLLAAIDEYWDDSSVHHYRCERCNVDLSWTYRGCYPDNTNQRTLYDGTSSSDSANTISKCLATCASSGYAFSVVEYGKECYCGNVIRSGVLAGSDSQCVTMACSRNGRCSFYGSANGTDG
jgi:hypothetical protein